MKKYCFIVALLAFLVGAPALCDDAVFDYSDDVQKVDIQPVNTRAVSKAEMPAVSTKAQSDADIQKANYEQAILNLDAAQAEIRDEYITYTQKYNEAKARYDVANAECKEYKKFMNETKKKIDNLEKTKKNIGKNLN